MPTINQLPVLNTISSGDQLPVYSPNNGDARRTSIGSLLTFFQQSFASPTVSTNLYTPGTGFNITAPTPVSEQQWMLLQPAGTLASGTITLPLNTGVPDGTQLLITTTQKITAFTLALNGAAAGYAFPTTLEAGAAFTARYYQATNSWYNISAELQYIFQDIFVDTINGLILGIGGGNVANNIAIGEDSLLVNTTGSGNTGLGYFTLKATTIGIENTAVGRGALLTNISGSYNVGVGGTALGVATGSFNTAIGRNAGGSISSGSKNTIIGNYSGNQGGLDIRTLSNYIVLSDGDGNPRGYWNGANATFDGDLTLTGTLIGNDIELSGPLTAAGNVLVNSSSGKIGYATGNGAGGTVTQATSRTTAVLLNKPTGAITLFSAAGTTVATTFTVTNSTVLATSVILLNQKSGADLYDLMVTAVAAGSFNITFRTTGGTTTETPVFSFAVISGSIA
jgi:hypothetical protein